VARDLSLDLIFRVLPSTVELAGLRKALLAAATEDPTRLWSGSGAYQTVDKRIVTSETLDAVFERAQERGVAHVGTMHRSVRRAIEALEAGNALAAAELVGLGEEASEDARWEECIAYYSVAHTVAAELDAWETRMLASRRLARAQLYLGHAEEAAQWYERSLGEATTVGSTEGFVSACVGLGNVACIVGRWRDAEGHYLRGLEGVDAGEHQLVSQLLMNLSMTARETGDFDLARERLQAAEEYWEELSQSDRSGWWNYHGLLQMELGELERGGLAFQNSLTLSTSHFDSAMILDNLAELHIRYGDLEHAEHYARQAEDFAVVAASDRALAEVYARLGRIMRLRQDPHGVTFFEKAMELARSNRYTLTEAQTCVEYAIFRDAMGDPDEAHGLRQRARQLYDELGTDTLPPGLAGDAPEG